MDNTPADRHVLAASLAADAHLVVTANTADFHSPRCVDSGRVRIQHPARLLTTVLDEHPDLMSGVLWHLATNRRGVVSIGDVLNALDRHEGLRPSWSSLVRVCSSSSRRETEMLKGRSHGGVAPWMGEEARGSRPATDERGHQAP